MLSTRNESFWDVAGEQCDLDSCESIFLYNLPFFCPGLISCGSVEEGGMGWVRSHFEKADMLMALTAESPGFALRNFTESVQWLFFQLLHVNIEGQQLV